MTVGALPINEVHLIPLEIAFSDLDEKFGRDGDLAVNMPIGFIYQKIAGVWTQIIPAIV